MSKTIDQIERSIKDEASILVKGRSDTVIFAYRTAKQAMLSGNFAPDELDPKIRQLFKSSVPVSPYVEQPTMIEQSRAKAPDLVPQAEHITDTVARESVHAAFNEIIAQEARMEQPAAERVDTTDQAQFDAQDKNILESEVNPINEQALSDLEAARNAANDNAVSAKDLLADLYSR